MADIDALVTFVAVVRAGSFHAAALALRVPRSTVSQRVARLEEQVGARLLERTTRVVKTTAAGALYFDRCGRILADLEAATAEVQELDSEPRGLLRVACPELFGQLYMPAIVAGFLRDHPQVEIEVVASNRRVNLLEDGFDLAVMLVDASEETSLVSRKLRASVMRCVASPGYAASRPLPARPAQVSDHACIVSGEARQATWRFERLRARVSDRKPPPPLHVAVVGRAAMSSFSMAMESAREGIGIATLPPHLCAEDLRRGTLVPVLPAWILNRTDMRVVYASKRHLSSRVRRFVDALVKGTPSFSASPGAS